MTSFVWRASKHLSARLVLKLVTSIFFPPVRQGAAKAGALLLSALCAMALSACSSLPEGAVAPKLTIDKVSINEQGATPKFVVLFTLEHSSASALPLYSVKADIFVREQKVAAYTQNYSKEMLPPNEKLHYRLEVPANLVGAASLDSLLHNSLLMLQGSCALSVTISTSPNDQNFNPSRSYYGLFSVE